MTSGEKSKYSALVLVAIVVIFEKHVQLAFPALFRILLL